MRSNSVKALKRLKVNSIIEDMDYYYIFPRYRDPYNIGSTTWGYRINKEDKTISGFCTLNVYADIHCGKMKAKEVKNKTLKDILKELELI